MLDRLARPYALPRLRWLGEGVGAQAALAEQRNCLTVTVYGCGLVIERSHQDAHVLGYFGHGYFQGDYALPATTTPTRG
jgi:hypothetical protein